jgi:hypothetical protein
MRNDIAALFDADGPFVSVYLDARSDQPQAQQALLTRWKTVRSQLAGEGATEDDLAAIDAALDDTTHVGGDTAALVAAGGRVLLARHLPETPAADAGRVGLLPWVGPLVETAQTLLPHLVVLVDRTGADLYGFTAEGESVEEEVSGAQQGPLLSKSPAGGWSQRRFQQRAVEAWEQNAREVAEEVAAMAKQVGARLVAVGGDVHAVRLLRDALPPDVAPMLREIEGATRHPDGSSDEAATAASRLVDTVIAEESVAVVQEFKQEQGQHDRAAVGPARTVEALQAAIVQTLLVHDDPGDDRMAWFGPDPGHLALDRETLEAMGVEHPQEGRLVDACIRAALGTSADIRVVPRAIVTDGLAAVLRHTGTSPDRPDQPS